MQSIQAIYETVRKYYADGNPFGYDSEERTCLYRGYDEDGRELRCAIGCQLTDLGPDGWENLLNDSGALRDLGPHVIEYIEHVTGHPGDKTFNFQAELQNIHDSTVVACGKDMDEEATRDELLKRLDAFAISQGLRVVHADAEN